MFLKMNLIVLNLIRKMIDRHHLTRIGVCDDGKVRAMCNIGVTKNM